MFWHKRIMIWILMSVAILHKMIVQQLWDGYESVLFMEAKCATEHSLLVDINCVEHTFCLAICSGMS